MADQAPENRLAQSKEAFVLRAITNSQTKVSGGWLAIKAVRDAYNEGRPEDHHVKERWVGGKVRGLGWEVGRVGHDNVTSLRWDDGLFETLSARYGLTQKAPGDDPREEVSRLHPQ